MASLETAISELGRRLDRWESKGHTTVGIDFLRNHFDLNPKPRPRTGQEIATAMRAVLDEEETP